MTFFSCERNSLSNGGQNLDGRVSLNPPNVILELIRFDTLTLSSSMNIQLKHIVSCFFCIAFMTLPKGNRHIA